MVAVVGLHKDKSPKSGIFNKSNNNNKLLVGRFCECNSLIAPHDPGSWSSRPFLFQYPTNLVLGKLLCDSGVALECELTCV
jgi:hypothetical protein